MPQIERRKSLDYAKGFAILLLLLSHAISSEPPIKSWIFSFHMPIFFIICGILQRMKSPQGLPLKKFGIHILKRFRQLLIPYFIWGIVLLAFYFALSIISHSPSECKSQLFSLFTLYGIDSLWFIPCYLFAEILFVFLIAKLSNIFKILTTVILSAYFIFWNFMGWSWEGNNILKQIHKIEIALIFICIGYIAEEVYQKVSSKKIHFLAIPFLILNIVLSQINGMTGIGALHFGNPFFYLVSGTCGSLAFIYLFDWIDSFKQIKLSILDTFGKNTIVVLCTNNLFIEIIRLLDYKFLGNILIKWEAIGDIIFTLILAILEYICIKLTQGKLGIFFGKIQQAKKLKI